MDPSTIQPWMHMDSNHLRDETLSECWFITSRISNSTVMGFLNYAKAGCLVCWFSTLRLPGNKCLKLSRLSIAAVVSHHPFCWPAANVLQRGPLRCEVISEVTLAKEDPEQGKGVEGRGRAGLILLFWARTGRLKVCLHSRKLCMLFAPSSILFKKWG